MLVYLDTNIVIYAIEGQAPLRQRALNHLQSLQTSGFSFAISDLVRLECLIKPLAAHDGALLLDYQAFFTSDVTSLPIRPAVFDRAASIRAMHRYATSKRYSVADSLHLSTAVEARCDLFLTHDHRLAGYQWISVQVLP